jgi:hypothetical protein
MSDACTISRAGTGEPVYDPETDTYTYPTAGEIYDGKCRVRPADTVDLDQEAGEMVTGARRYVVLVPMSVTDVHRNDIVDVTASALDSALVGTRFRVLGSAKGSQITARRLACEEVSE